MFDIFTDILMCKTANFEKKEEDAKVQMTV